MNLTERAEIRKETFYKLTNSADVPDYPNGHRNLAQLSSSSWSKAYTNFDGNINKTPGLGNVLTDGMRVGDEFKARIVLKYDNIVPAEGKTAKVWMQGSGNVTNWGAGGFPNTSGQKVLSGSGEIVFESTETIRAEHLQNAYWNWAFRLDYVASGSIQWKEGKVEIGQNFTPYTPAPEQLGWSMTTLVPTQSQRYLWKFEYVYYSDGSVEIIQPTNISIAGADGTNGQTSHVHFAFADNATGGGFSLTTPKAYMGWYADFNEAASNDPTKYRWGKWKGDQGVPGEKGDDGKTSYFHLAYASSADGKTGFSFKESGQQYQGYYTDFTQTSSTDPNKYTWIDRRAGVEVGGRNLYVISKASKGFISALSEALGLQDSKNKEYTSDYISVSPNEKFMFQGWVTIPESGASWRSWQFYGADKKKVGDRPTNGGQTTVGLQHYTHAITVPNNADIKYIRVSARLYEDGKLKLERGNVATDYSLAPEDVQSDIDSKADQALTQEQLNALAEQNSIVKAEMEAKASIDTVNQWITAYQNYVNANDEARAESEKNLQEAAARILQLKTDVGALRQQWDFIDTYMSIQNEGLIIGKSDGSAFAKFANDRISLFSGSSEVMYISQGTLHIENGIFTKTIQIGRFRFETHPADADMLVLRYLGG